MTVVFLGVLVLAWVVVFIPSSIRRRRELPASSAQRFREGMGLLARTLPGSGRWVMVPGSESRPTGGPRPLRQSRRIALLKGCLGLVAVTFLAALLQPSLWNLHLLADAALAGYVAFLIGAKRRREEARRKVSPLRSARPSRMGDEAPSDCADVGGNRA